MPTVIQLTDTHLFRSRADRLHGVSTWTRFDRVLAEVQRRWPHADRLVITGDIAHDEVEPTYALLRTALGDWADRTVVVPGNHDHRGGLSAHFSPPMGDTSRDRMGFDVAVGPWRLIGLDTHQPGEEAGALDDAQLEWCAERLTRHAPGPALLFMHHPPVSVGNTWLDVIALQNPGAFHALVARTPNLRGIACGHVHQQFEGRLHGRPVLTTPSTAFQFTPGIPDFAMDRRPPGFRVFDLNADGWSSEVVWLPDEL